MAKLRPYIVTPHGPLEELDDNLWAVSSVIPGLNAGHRRMTIIRRDDGRLVFYNAVPVDDALLERIRGLGEPAEFVAPQQEHCLDGRAFCEKLGLAAYTSRASSAKLAGRLPLAGVAEELASDKNLRFEIAEGTGHGEVVAFVTTQARVSLVTADVIQNHTQTALFFRMFGFSGIRTPPLFKFLYLKDKEALRAQMLRWADLPGLSRLVPSHGPVIETDVPGLIRRVAAGL